MRTFLTVLSLMALGFLCAGLTSLLLTSDFFGLPLALFMGTIWGVLHRIGNKDVSVRMQVLSVVSFAIVFSLADFYFVHPIRAEG